TIAKLSESIASFKTSGAGLRLPYYFGLVAQACGRAGLFDDGLAAIDEAIAASRAHNECWWDAELHRIRGMLLVSAGGDASEAEAAYASAIEIAQAQQARALELRAATSMARLWRRQHRNNDGRRLLKTVYSSFSEGFDTTDLREAKTLLEE